MQQANSSFQAGSGLGRRNGPASGFHLALWHGHAAHSP